MIYILIVVISAYTHGSGSGRATIVAEFSSWETCETARKHIVKDVAFILTQGCHLK